MDNELGNEFGLLNDDEVLFVRMGRVLMANPTFKVSEFLDALAQLVSEREDDWSEAQEGWFTDRGLSCEALRFGNGAWQRGRVRIRLEFCPERSDIIPARPKLLQETFGPREPARDSDSRQRDSYFKNRWEDSYGSGKREDIYGRDDVHPPRNRDDFSDYSDFDQDY
jgi:hypothetical protein